MPMEYYWILLYLAEALDIFNLNIDKLDRVDTVISILNLEKNR